MHASSPPDPKPGPPVIATARRHPATAALTTGDLSLTTLKINRIASTYAAGGPPPPDPSKAS